MTLYNWLLNNWVEVFGAATGILYVFLEIRQNLWLWPVGILTSAVYISVFFSSKFYADMGLQVYYLLISCAGLYWWVKGTSHRVKGGSKGNVVIERERSGSDNNGVSEIEKHMQRSEGSEGLKVSRLKSRTGFILAGVFVTLYISIWYVLSRFTDSPVPEWDSFLTSLSIVATWMLARKIYEHWFLWIVVNLASSVIFLVKNLYPTVILYLIYLVMSFVGLKEWKRSL